jgi:hypothetical protein
MDDRALPHEWATADVVTDEELEALALAADPDVAIDPDAVPFGSERSGATNLLPEWYMPVPQGARRTPARMVGAAAFIGALVIVNGAGLCVTYGLPEIAW